MCRLDWQSLDRESLWRWITCVKLAPGIIIIIICTMYHLLLSAQSLLSLLLSLSISLLLLSALAVTPPSATSPSIALSTWVVFLHGIIRFFIFIIPIIDASSSLWWSSPMVSLSSSFSSSPLSMHDMKFEMWNWRYSSKLSSLALPSVVFEPRFRGEVTSLQHHLNFKF